MIVGRSGHGETNKGPFDLSNCVADRLDLTSHAISTAMYARLFLVLN